MYDPTIQSYDSGRNPGSTAGLSTTQLNSTRSSGSGAGPLRSDETKEIGDETKEKDDETKYYTLGPPYKCPDVDAGRGSTAYT